MFWEFLGCSLVNNSKEFFVVVVVSGIGIFVRRSLVLKGSPEDKSS